jgi:hypothetical protein
MEELKIFIVEDDPFFGETLKYHLKLNPDFTVFYTGLQKNVLIIYIKNQISFVLILGYLI